MGARLTQRSSGQGLLYAGRVPKPGSSPEAPPAHHIGGDAAPFAQTSDEDLMRRYVNGDQPAFTALFTRYTPRVYGYLVHCTGNRALAEDLTQQTWLRLHHARATFRDGARVAPWIYTIAANLRRDHARDSVRTRESLTADGSAPEPTPDAVTPEAPAQAAHDAQERAAAVHRALAALPEGAREVIVLHRWHDLGFAEIAALQGTTEGAVKVRAHRGYLKLRELLNRAGLP